MRLHLTRIRVSHYFIISEITAILADKKACVLSKWNLVSEILVKHHIVYTRIARIGEIAVHPLNRSGMGVDPFEVHRKLSAILEVGADLSLLAKATCFELPPAGPEREAALAFNASLIKASNGLLAPLTGDERLLSVACSHSTAGFRAAQANCLTTTWDGMGDADNKLNSLTMSTKDPVMKQVFDKGYPVIICPWYAAKLWPELPDVAQEALNAEHGAIAPPSELQCMHSLIQRLKYSSSLQTDWKPIVAAIAATSPHAKII